VNCPHGHGTLLMSERQGVEIDYCPECRGVWLDRGELDKIIERAAAESDVGDRRPDVGRRPDPEPDRDRRDPRGDDRYRDERPAPEPTKKKKKRTSFLEDLFEF
jgi:Zn-finger nucleic acid-binding protein